MKEKIIDDKIILNEIISYIFNSDTNISESDDLVIRKYKDGYPKTLYTEEKLSDIETFRVNLKGILKKKFIDIIINIIISKYKVPGKSLHITSKIFNMNKEY